MFEVSRILKTRLFEDSRISGTFRHRKKILARIEEVLGLLIDLPSPSSSFRVYGTYTSLFDLFICSFFLLVFKKMSSKLSPAAQVAHQLHSVDEQRELFLWKYRDIKREDVQELMKVLFFFICFILVI